MNDINTPPASNLPAEPSQATPPTQPSRETTAAPSNFASLYQKTPNADSTPPTLPSLPQITAPQVKLLTGMFFLILSLGLTTYFLYQRNLSNRAKAVREQEPPQPPLNRLTPTITPAPTMSPGPYGGPTIPRDQVVPVGRTDCCELALAFDGDQNTFWVGAPGNNIAGQTWTLGHLYAATVPAGGKVSISYYGAPYYPASAELHISADGSTWTAIGQVVNQPSNEFSIQQAWRYLRLTFFGGGQSAPYVREVTVTVNGAVLTPIPTSAVTPSPTPTSTLTPTPTRAVGGPPTATPTIPALTTNTPPPASATEVPPLGGQCQAIKFYALAATSATPGPTEPSQNRPTNTPVPTAPPTPSPTITPYSRLTIHPPGENEISPTPEGVDGRVTSLRRQNQPQGEEIPRDSLRRLRPGERIRIAVVVNENASGQRVTKARIRVQAVAGGAWLPNQETTNKNDFGEFYVDYTIPTGQRTFVVEAQVFDVTGGWR